MSEKKKDDEALFDIRLVMDEKTQERWADALCVFCGATLFRITKEDLEKPVPPGILLFAGLHVALACPGKERRKSPKS